MTREDAKRIITNSIREHGVAEITEEYKEGFNDGMNFMVTLVKLKVDKLNDILSNPPHVD